MSYFRTLIVFLFVSLTLTVSGQILKPVKWSFSSDNLGNNEFLLKFKADIAPEWTVYSQRTSDDGPVPTYIEYESKDGIELVGESKERGHKKEGFDKIFEVDVIKFLGDQPFVIEQKVKLTDPSKNTVSGYLTFMTCDKTRCLPPTDIDFSFKLDATPEKIPVKEVKQAVEKPNVSVKTTIKEKTTTSTKETKTAASEEKLVEYQPDDGGILKPVTWSFSSSELGDDEYVLIFEADIDPKWTVYSQYTSDDGPVPTYIEYEKKDGIELIGKSVEKGHKKEGHDKIFEVDVIKFLGDQPFIIEQKVKVTDPIKNKVSGYLTFMTCDDSRCLPPTDVDFSFVLGENKGASSSSGSGVSGLNINGDYLEQRIPSIVTTYESPPADCGGEEKLSTGLWSIFLGGFVGGLLAILLPCIFPMIPITVSYFTKDTKKKGWVNGLIYGLSIIVIFVSIGLAITALLGPEALNKLSTNWVANTIFFIIFVAFAFSFFGFFEITLPSSWSTKSDTMADKGGLLGTFFMAATLAIVSFSCTGPIIGTALVQVASTGNYLGPFLIMFGFSLALAIPFGLFAAFPAWLNSLPKSGSWMNSVKVVLGFLELALALKFLSIADMTSGWDVLKYELFLGLWIIIFLGLTAYLLGFIKFPHDSPLKKLSPLRLGFSALSLLFAIYLTLGFRVNPETETYLTPRLTSGLTPPGNYNFFLKPPDLDPIIKDKYDSYTWCANNIPCFKDYYQGLAYAKEVNRPLLVDFTGEGCVNCRKTEDYIWVDPSVRQTLSEEYVLTSLYVDVRKKLDHVYLSDRGDEGIVKLRNVGNLWSDFQIKNFAQNSQPLYVLMDTDQQVMSAPRGYREGVKSYKSFLDCGLTEFNK